MAEFKLLDQRHYVSIRVTYISMKTPNKGYNEVYDTFSFKKISKATILGCEVSFFGQKKLKAPMEGYNRACEGYNSFIEVFNIRDFDIG